MCYSNNSLKTACIKGTALVGIVKVLRKRREIAEKHLDPELHSYLSDRILAGSWYPERDYHRLLEVYRLIWPDRSWEEIGRLGAREGLQGIYRNIIKNDLATSVRQMRANWRNYHDTGDLISDIDGRIIRVQVCNYPVVSKDLCLLNQGYFLELLALSGADIVGVRKLRCTALKDKDCLWEFERVVSP